jgi:hypothetical protein
MALCPGVVLTIIGLYFIANTILSSSYLVMSIWQGILFWNGLTDVIALGNSWFMRKAENKNF